MKTSRTRHLALLTIAAALAITAGVGGFIVTRKAALDTQTNIKRIGAALDWSTYVPGTDGSAMLQSAIDVGGPVQIPEQRVTLLRPVYLPSSADVRGNGAASELYAPNGDALIAMPAGQRNYDPTPHFAGNSVDGNRWAFRSKAGSARAGIRIHNGRVDTGWQLDDWRGVRQFSVETVVTRNDQVGTIAGQAWRVGGADFRASPWRISQRGDWTGYTSFHLTTSDDVEHEYRFHGAVYVAASKLVFKVNLDAGTVLFEQDGLAISDVVIINGAIPAGATLHENRGAPLWLGGGNEQAGGSCPPELSASDTTFHTFRVWRTATPPGSGYDPFGWYPNTVAVIPFANADKPRAGDPAIYYTGEFSSYGFVVPFSNVGWVQSVRLDNMTFTGEQYGTGLQVISATDVQLTRLRFNKGRVGVQVMGGPLPCYPVRMRDITGDHQNDSVARVHRSIVREFENVTAKYPRRSVARFDQCGEVFIRDVFHAGENAGTGNTVTDCLRLDGCIRMRVEAWTSNYEDGYGPRYSYLCVTGTSPEPSQPQTLRVRDFGKQSLRAGAMYLDSAGAPACDIQLFDSF